MCILLESMLQAFVIASAGVLDTETKANAVSVDVSFEDERTIDTINIRNATFKCMHQSIRKIINNHDDKHDDTHDDKSCYHLLIDGNDFKPFIYTKQSKFYQIPHTCIEKGDNLYASIAAASFVAKVERDQYIRELCEDYPKLDEFYNLSKNKG